MGRKNITLIFRDFVVPLLYRGPMKKLVLAFAIAFSASCASMTGAGSSAVSPGFGGTDSGQLLIVVRSNNSANMGRIRIECVQASLRLTEQIGSY